MFMVTTKNSAKIALIVICVLMFIIIQSGSDSLPLMVVHIHMDNLNRLDMHVVHNVLVLVLVLSS